MLADLKMLCPALVLALAVLCLCSSEVDGQCWENTRCQDLSSEENILECIQLCKLDLTAEFPIYPGNGLLEPLTEAEGSDAGFLPTPGPSVDEEALTGAKEPGPRREDKRSYSMEHFRWGKPVGRKRRPIKVYANGVEEESTEAHPVELRRGLSDNQDYPVGEAVGEAAQDKKDGSYRMNHFRWSGPPANKRYGGFLKSWDERSQKPLLTLFRNVIIKDSHLSKTE